VQTVPPPLSPNSTTAVSSRRPRDILADTHDLLRTSSRGCYEENCFRMEFKLYSAYADIVARIADTAISARCALCLDVASWSVCLCVLAKGTMQIDGLHMGATWQIRLNDQCSAAMRAVASVTAATCCYCSAIKSAFHDTDIDTDIIAMILASMSLSCNAALTQHYYNDVSQNCLRTSRGRGHVTRYLDCATRRR